MIVVLRRSEEMKMRKIIFGDWIETYEAWVMMSHDNDIGVVTEEHETSEEALNEMLEKMSIEELREKGYTLNKLLCTSGCYLECLEEIEY